MVPPCSLRDSKSLQVCWTFLSILADINKAVVFMFSTRPIFSSPYINSLVTVPSASIIIGITVTFMFLSFFQFSCKVKVFILLYTFFQYYSMVSRYSKVHNSAISLFCLLWLGAVVWPRLDFLVIFVLLVLMLLVLFLVAVISLSSPFSK